ncbi:MAG TPA: glycosyltransferase family 1 protein [Vicinamibacterales bacterium]|nr:glycosyltransferase family 1 protein [Vicinamibacterales bacterium]
MRIAVDARELVGRRTGVGRYLERLLTHWAHLPAARGHEFTLYSHAPVDGDWAAPLSRVVLPGAGGTRWEQGTLGAALRRAHPDVLFAPAYTAPLLSGVPFVLSLHDVSFLAHPEWFAWRERWRRRIVTRASAQRAEVVLTLTDFSRREIERRAGVPASRIRVIPPGVDLPPATSTSPPPAEPQPVVLYVGTLLNRRHVPALIQAVALASERVPDIRLIIAGDNRTWPRQDPAAIASALGIGPRVHVRSFVDDEELRRLYASASVFVFLSEYEGFGLTPLEALAAGAAPIVLDTVVAREVYGRAARYVERPDPTLVADAIVEQLRSASAREALLAEAPAVLARYRWSDTAAATLAALLETAEAR